MKSNIAVPLSDSQPSERIVKRGALLLFRGLRALTEQAAKAPGVIAQATADVKSAWQEAASDPKA
ncbi:MAG: hypothetical protein NT123_22345 [Proteobacteria bacterium]|nr:hypothetical protein [Pseudomonadota bacterium]